MMALRELAGDFCNKRVAKAVQENKVEHRRRKRIEEELSERERGMLTRLALEAGFRLPNVASPSFTVDETALLEIAEMFPLAAMRAVRACRALICTLLLRSSAICVCLLLLLVRKGGNLCQMGATIWEIDIFSLTTKLVRSGVSMLELLQLDATRLIVPWAPGI